MKLSYFENKKSSSFDELHCANKDLKLDKRYFLDNHFIHFDQLCVFESLIEHFLFHE